MKSKGNNKEENKVTRQRKTEIEKKKNREILIKILN